MVWTSLCTISAAIYAKIKRSKICRKRIHFIHTYIYYTLFFCWINYDLKGWLIADYIHIPPQTPALDKGGACGKAMPCSPLARWVDIGIMGSYMVVTIPVVILHYVTP